MIGERRVLVDERPVLVRVLRLRVAWSSGDVEARVFESGGALAFTMGPAERVAGDRWRGMLSPQHQVPPRPLARPGGADRAEAQTLLEALPPDQWALWACAFYGGLRRGELRALKWLDIDLEAGAIRVSRTWDDVEGHVATKSEAGDRSVPLAGMLRRTLVEHKLASGRGGDDLVFGRTAVDPFIPSTVNFRARRAWGWTRVPNPDRNARPREIWIKAREDALEPLTQHEARHSAASYLIEAGLNDLELTAMIGHSDARTTKAIYGHLFPDSRATITAKLDAYLGRSHGDADPESLAN